MTYAPAELLTARAFLVETVPGLSGAEVGIVGDTAHAATGSSYHLGKSQLVNDSYSIVESSRDRNGLTNAASALDIGEFSFSAGGRTHTQRTFSAWLVAECKSGGEGTADIREVIYSLDGQTVKRWDRLGRRSSGDSSHRWHTHISYFRDSEKRDKTALFERYLTEAGLIKGKGQDSMLVKKGDSGQEVTYSQYLLAELGYPVGAIDGVYGPKMESAVNAYRKAHGNPGTTDATMITGWHLFHMQRAVAQKFAGRDGRDGAPGPAGPQGPAGRDGSAIGGNLTVTGGTLRVVASEQG